MATVLPSLEQGRGRVESEGERRGQRQGQEGLAGFAGRAGRSFNEVAGQVPARGRKKRAGFPRLTVPWTRHSSLGRREVKEDKFLAGR